MFYRFYVLAFSLFLLFFEYDLLPFLILKYCLIAFVLYLFFYILHHLFVYFFFLFKVSTFLGDLKYTCLSFEANLFLKVEEFLFLN